MQRHDIGTSRLAPLAAATALVAAAGLVLSAAGQAPRIDALKTLMPAGTLIGTAINQRQGDGGDPVALQVVDTHFNTITPENLLKWGPVHPEPGRYQFEPADRYVAFGEARGLAIIGHTLVWHQQTPRWVFTADGGGRADRETLLRRMRDHITTVVGRYKGRIRGWDVVNEALEEDGTLRRSPWLEIIGDDYIAKAFEYAREADPQAELYYNDYNLWKPAKRQGAIRLVAQLRARGLRVDAIGEQGHWLLDEPAADAIDATLRDIAAAGVKAVITELDVDVLPREEGMYGADLSKQQAYQASTNLYAAGLPAEVQERLAKRYADIFRIFVAHRAHLTRVTFWGVTDATTWLHNFPIRGRVNYPLLFDKQGQPKPAFDAVVKVLREKR